jgi:hypothetical protein
MSVFVPGCQHDIFVSYAHVDNQVIPGAERGWISTLSKGVEKRLDQKLGQWRG